MRLFIVKILRLTIIQVLVVFAVMIISTRGLAQINSYYSSNATKWLINPSLIGDNEFDWNIYNVLSTKRALMNKQRNAILLGGDYKFFLFPDEIKMGGIVARSSYVGFPVSDFEFAGTIAYQKRMPGGNISAGFQASFVQVQVDANQLIFPDQYNHLLGGYDVLTPSAEPLSVNNVSYFDATAGAAYDFNLINYKSRIGLTVFHLNQPKYSFSLQDERKPIEMLLHLNTLHRLNNLLSLQPEYYMFNSDYFIEHKIGAVLGLNSFRFSIPVKSVSFASYLSLRNNEYPDLVLTQLGFKFYKITCLLNYDFSLGINNSSLLNYKVFEMGIVFNGFNSNPPKYVIPCQVF